MKRSNIKKGKRYLNHLGEYCIIKSIYKNVVKLQICGDTPRIDPYHINDFKKLVTYRFFEVPFPKINRTNVARHLLEYQLNLIGKTTATTKSNSNWFKEWSLKEYEFKLLKSYAIPLLKKIFKFNTSKAKDTFNWWYMHFGLKIINKKI